MDQQPQGKPGGPVPLELRGGGFTAVRELDRIHLEPEWEIAKGPFTSFTFAQKRHAAETLIQRHWSKEQSVALVKKYGGREPVFITVPSTTGVNAVPPLLAEEVALAIPGARMLAGENHAWSLSPEQMKTVVNATKRMYTYRPYELDNPQDLAEKIAGSPVVVVEDIITSGVSVKGFCLALADGGIAVDAVVCLVGDPEIQCPGELRQNLTKVLQTIHLEDRGAELGEILTKWQAVNLVDRIQKARSHAIRRDIARKVRRLLDLRIARTVAQHRH